LDRVNKYKQSEIDYWKNIYKKDEVLPDEVIAMFDENRKVFDKNLEVYKEVFDSSKIILEVAGGNGWLSCLIKSYYPKKEVIYSDLSPWAIKQLHLWEKHYGVKLDQSFAAPSDDIPLPDKSVDLIICNNSAHHLQDKSKTFKEFDRLLRKNGKILFLHEPSCSKPIYYLAYLRVNIKRKKVHEDLLIPSDIKRLSDKLGYKLEVKKFLFPENRGRLEGLYYKLLRKYQWLTPFLPGCYNYYFRKQSS
jgi:ubiquinone/menaquinone biosynthesis C-methylase UbiE